jgi:hypothetical protein
MAEDEERDRRPKVPQPAEDRRQRLAEAMRANLRRRKAQARARELPEEGEKRGS